NDSSLSRLVVRVLRYFQVCSIMAMVILRRSTRPTLFPYTTLFRSVASPWHNALAAALPVLLLCLGLRVLSPKAALVFKGAILLRSEEHTSELQSRENLVCRLLLEKKKHLSDFI